MDSKAVVRLNFSSNQQLKVVMQALRPEIESSSTNRSKVGMNADGQCLVLDFKATDTSALRAAMNSYLRLVSVAMKLQQFSE